MSNKGNSSAEVGGGAALAPMLRFPEFAGDAIQDLKLGDVTTESTERNGYGQAVAQIMGVSKVDGIIPMEERIVAADTTRYKLVRKDWFAYNPMRLNIGSIARWQGGGDILVSPDYVVFKCKSGGPQRLYPAYLDHFRRSDAWDGSVSEKGDGGVRVRIYYKELARLRLALPSYREQQKIADCLDSLEALIAARGLKLEALRAHKKGLMQQLFPQEGETEPRLRFPEFEGAEEWVEKSVGDFGQVVTGSTPSTADSSLYGGGIPFVSPGDISELRYVDETKTTLTPAGFEKARPIRAGSVLLVCIGSTIGKIAQNVRECATNQQINAVIPNARHSGGFVYFALSNATDRITLLAGKQAVPIINKSLFSSVRLLVPGLPEQQRIADCLTSLDDLIAAETRKLGTLKVHKKGLMQQLFPKVGEADA